MSGFYSRAALLLVEISIAGVIATGCQSPRSIPAETQLKKVDPTLIDVLRERGEANVMVALLEPAVDGQPIQDRTIRRAQIARMQREVLSKLSEQDYRSRVLFQEVPAMAGTILHERAVRVLDAHAHVVKVDPDPAGGGIRN